MTIDPGITLLESGEDGVLVDRSTRRDRPRRDKPATEAASQTRTRERWNTPARWPLDRVKRKLGPTRLRGLAEMFTELGLEHRAAPILDTLDDADKIDDALAANNVDELNAKLVVDIAAGKITPAAAAKRLAEYRPDLAPMTRQLLAEARAAVVLQAITALYDAGDELVTEIDGIIQTAVGVVTDAAERITGIRDDADAARAPDDQLAAWRTLTAARDRIDRCHSLAHHLRGLGIVHDLPGPAFPPEAWRDRNPAALISVPRSVHSHPNHHLAALIATGAQPAALTAAEVVALHGTPQPPKDAA